MLIVERTPFEKGASLKLSPENFCFYFSPYRARTGKKKTCNIQVALYKGKNQIKVFGKGFGVTPRSAGRCPKDKGARLRQRNPFLRKGSPDN